MRIEVVAVADLDDEDVTEGREISEGDLADAAHDAVKNEVSTQLGVPAGFVTVNVEVDA